MSTWHAGWVDRLQDPAFALVRVAGRAWASSFNPDLHADEGGDEGMGHDALVATIREARRPRQ